MDACKQDCFFDGNSGAGNDGCLWQLKCDPRSINTKCPYGQQYAEHTRTSARCRPLSRSRASTSASWCRTAAIASVAASSPAPRRPSCSPRPARRPTSATPPSARPARRSRSARTPASTASSASASRRAGRLRPADGGTDSGTPPPQLRQRLPGLWPGDRPRPSQCPTGTGCMTGCCSARSSRDRRFHRPIQPATGRSAPPRSPRMRPAILRVENGRLGDRPRYWHVRGLRMRRETKTWAGRLAAPLLSSSCSRTSRTTSTCARAWRAPSCCERELTALQRAQP